MSSSRSRDATFAMPESRWNARALSELTLLRVREFIREPEAVFWALAFPVILAAGLGVAFRAQPNESLRVAAVTASLASALGADSRLIVDELDGPSATQALETGRVVLVAEPTDRGVVYRYDSANPEARTARLLADHALQVAAGRVDPVSGIDEIAHAPGSRYIDFLIPGLVGMGIMGNAVWGLGFSIVDTRRRKLLKRLVATPMRRSDYLLSFLLWRLFLLVFEVGVPVAFGVLVFGVPLRGAIVELALIAVAGSLAFSALGLLVASRARTIEGVSSIMNLVMMPMWILSGIFFSADRFPEAVQPFIDALPLTALIDALRGNMLEGVTIGALGPELGTLGVWLAVCFGSALLLFRWR